jgi:hypothetical protein
MTPDPMPGIRAVLIAGFVSGNSVDLIFLALEGHLLESLELNPLALFGALLGVGIAGMMTGAFAGLIVKLVQEKRGATDVGGPVIVSAVISGLVGFAIANAIIGVLW